MHKENWSSGAKRLGQINSSNAKKTKFEEDNDGVRGDQEKVSRVRIVESWRCLARVLQLPRGEMCKNKQSLQMAENVLPR